MNRVCFFKLIFQIRRLVWRLLAGKKKKKKRRPLLPFIRNICSNQAKTKHIYKEKILNVFSLAFINLKSPILLLEHHKQW